MRWRPRCGSMEGGIPVFRSATLNAPLVPVLDWHFLCSRSRRTMAQPEVVMITGASAGVGRATAIAFAREGARIGLLARGHAGLQGAKRDVEAAGGQAIILPADVADAQAVEDSARILEHTFGPIDIWINNA